MGEARVESIFLLSNLLVMPFWLLIILAPHWRWTQRIVASPWIVAPAALLYAALVTPKSIAALLGTPAGATIAWAHFLAFDLFVGRWAYMESRRLRISAWVVSPLLFLILMLGPLGLLLFMLLRATAERRPQPSLAGA